MQIDDPIIDLCPKLDHELMNILQTVYKPNRLTMANLVKESESKKYNACTFTINSINIKFRVARITPKKSGQFVTLWKRVDIVHPIQPYDLSDAVDRFVISVRNNNHHGQFVFPKTVLFEKGVISQGGKGGKRAIRVYPPWDVAESRQAKETQEWQLDYFLDTSRCASINCERVKKLYFNL